MFEWCDYLTEAFLQVLTAELILNKFKRVEYVLQLRLHLFIQSANDLVFPKCWIQFTLNFLVFGLNSIMFRDNRLQLL